MLASLNETANSNLSLTLIQCERAEAQQTDPSGWNRIGLARKPNRKSRVAQVIDFRLRRSSAPRPSGSLSRSNELAGASRALRLLKQEIRFPEGSFGLFGGALLWVARKHKVFALPRRRKLRNNESSMQIASERPSDLLTRKWLEAEDGKHNANDDDDDRCAGCT